MPFFKVIRLVCLNSLDIERIQLIMHISEPHDSLLVHECLQRVNQHQGVRMVGHLESPVMIMVLLVVVSMCKHTRLTENAWLWFTLSAQAYNLLH